MNSEQQDEIKPGVYDITIDQYHNGAGISRSTLFEIEKSPKHFYHTAYKRKPVVLDKIVRSTDALQFGNALHTMVLEPQLFKKEYLVTPPIKRNTKVGKAAFEEALEEAGSRQIIEEDTFKTICDMADSVHSDKWAKEMIEGAAYEQSIFFKEEITDILCKVRPDAWHENMIVDLKTSKDGCLRKFTGSVFGYGYHVQAGMIYQALKSLGKDVKNFIYVVIEKEPPYAVGVYTLDDYALDCGVKTFNLMIQKAAYCMEENNWPSYTPGVIGLPRWADIHY